jgi:hypothetical protein
MSVSHELAPLDVKCTLTHMQRRASLGVKSLCVPSPPFTIHFFLFPSCRVSFFCASLFLLIIIIVARSLSLVCRCGCCRCRSRVVYTQKQSRLMYTYTYFFSPLSSLSLFSVFVVVMDALSLSLLPPAAAAALSVWCVGMLCMWNTHARRATPDGNERERILGEKCCRFLITSLHF